jgi:CBS domain-containing protein
MQDLVKDWMIDLVVYIGPESTVLEAITLMRRRYLNSLIVKLSENSPEYGIITSTDICDKIVAQKRNPASTKVKDVMTTPLISAAPDETIYECARKMSDHNIHHMPVMDESKKVIAMISATDFLLIAESLGHDGGDRQLR